MTGLVCRISMRQTRTVPFHIVPLSPSPVTQLLWSVCLPCFKICADTSCAFTLFRICESKAARAYKQNQEYKYEEQNGAVIIKNIAEKTTVGHSKTPPHYMAHQCKRLLCCYYKYIPERFNRLQKQSVTVRVKIWRSIKRARL